MRNLQFDAPGRIGLDDVNKVPRDFAWRDTQKQSSERARRDHPFEQAANRATRSYVHSANF